MGIKFNGKCHDCSNKAFSKNRNEIGSQVNIVSNIGDTNHTFYQCCVCGSLWIKIQDQGGISGKGTFYYSLTEKFY